MGKLLLEPRCQLGCCHGEAHLPAQQGLLWLLEFLFGFKVWGRDESAFGCLFGWLVSFCFILVFVCSPGWSLVAL